MDSVKRHFEEEAQEFDDTILKLIPHYREMIDGMVRALPFPADSRISVIDLGCGTGTISKAVKEVFPNAEITCLDLAGNMIKMAKLKLAGFADIHYLVGTCN